MQRRMDLHPITVGSTILVQAMCGHTLSLGNAQVLIEFHRFPMHDSVDKFRHTDLIPY
jgi:hypothetical protein